jgi:hypothetical protein
MSQKEFRRVEMRTRGKELRVVDMSRLLDISFAIDKRNRCGSDIEKRVMLGCSIAERGTLWGVDADRRQLIFSARVSAGVVRNVRFRKQVGEQVFEVSLQEKPAAAHRGGGARCACD